MKKSYFIFSVIFFITLHCSAAEQGWPDIRMAQPLLDVKWSPIQISVWPISLVPAADHTYTADIYGLNLNLTTLFHCQNNVYGLSCGVFQTFEKKYGMTVALINGGGEIYGFAVGIANIFFTNNGVCVGIINDAINRNTSITGDGKEHRRKTANILQVGLFNNAHEGCQLGLFNVIKKADISGFAVQFGLLNHNPNAAIPWLPFFNYSSDTKDKKQK